MTVENGKTEQQFVLLTAGGKIAFTTDTLQSAEARRLKVNPEWRIMKTVTHYEEITPCQNTPATAP